MAAKALTILKYSFRSILIWIVLKARWSLISHIKTLIVCLNSFRRSTTIIHIDVFFLIIIASSILIRPIIIWSAIITIRIVHIVSSIIVVVILIATISQIISISFIMFRKSNANTLASTWKSESRSWILSIFCLILTLIINESYLLSREKIIKKLKNTHFYLWQV